MSTIKVDITTAKNILSRFVTKHIEDIESGKKVTHSPVYFHSSPGIGKSAVTRQVSEDLGIGIVDVRLAAMESSDIQGIPYVSQKGADTEEMRFSLPDWFPTDPDSKGILFLDELSNAPIQTQHAAYRLILDRSLHNEYKLPEGWVIVAAGNLKSDKTGVKGVAPALANRFGTHIEIRPDKDAFMNYAVKKGFDSRIIGYLEFDAGMLYQFDPARNEVAFPTPRSWEQVNHILNLGFSDDSPEFTAVLSGCVGEAAASKFQAFQKYHSQLPNFEEVMKGKTEYTVKDDLGIKFALTTALLQHMIDNNTDADRVANLEKILKQLEDEFLALFYKLLRNTGDDKIIISVLQKTMGTFKRVSKKIRMQ